MLLKKVDSPLRYGVVELRSGGRVRRFVGRPSTAGPGALVNVGVYVLEPAELSTIRPGLLESTPVRRKATSGKMRFASPDETAQ
jgi:NDP-sugar pyrophosphorylase family protein